MGKVVAGMTVSLDGFVNDRNGDTSRLFPPRPKIRELEVVKRAMDRTGAVLMGRRAYEMAHGDFTTFEYQVPIYVLTHQPPERVARGENDHLRFHFVSESPEMAVAQARDAAAGKDVTVVGGVSVVQQLLHRGLVDELVVGLASVVLGGGLRFFEGVNDAGLAIEQVEVISGQGRTDVRYRVIGVG
jgi:dihydrofolate reductase